MATVNLEESPPPFDGRYAIETIIAAIRSSYKTDDVTFEIPAEFMLAKDEIDERARLQLIVLVSIKGRRLIEREYNADFADILAQHVDLTEIANMLTRSPGFSAVEVPLQKRGVKRGTCVSILGTYIETKFRVRFH